jgi:RIO kinase 1
VTNQDSYYDEYDQYAHYEEQFDRQQTDRRTRRKRKPRIKHQERRTQEEIVAEFADAAGLEGGFNTTYQPSQYEESWLVSSLRTFFDQALITDVLAVIKGGKEASVYRCAAHPSTGQEFVAAKVYRPRMFRQLRNDKLYREGRAVLTGSGRAVKNNEHRIMRALGKKTAFGLQVAHTSWLMYEFTTMQQLYRVGAAVPQPIASNDNAILMSYHGDAELAAPILSEIQLEPDEVQPLFDEVLRNVELMLEHELVHGDLSAYNILYWDGAITLIDFPQVVNIYTNANAYNILERDLTRICEYFARQGLTKDLAALLDDLWARYGGPFPGELLLDESM